MKRAFAHLQPVRPSFPATPARWACLLLLLLAGSLRASDLPEAVTMDLPLPADQVMPAWLGHPEIPSTALATLNLPILTPDTHASLLVTVYFQEKQGGFMRVVWKGTQGAQLLSDNFYEDIGMSNQRSLLLSPAMLLGDGILTFQCGDSTLGIARIRLEWLETKTALVSPDVTDLLVTPAIGPTLPALSLNGQTNPAEGAAWQDMVVSVPISDQALRVEQGVEFSIDLDKIPASARLALKETGLPMGKHLVVWINEKRAGTVTPAVPDLLDDGFVTGEAAPASYVGWRDGSFYVPVALLTTGVNTLQFSEEEDGAPAEAGATGPDTATEPLALKSIVMQLDYEPRSAGTGALQPQLSSATTGPISPADPSSTPPETTQP